MKNEIEKIDFNTPKFPFELLWLIVGILMVGVVAKVLFFVLTLGK